MLLKSFVSDIVTVELHFEEDGDRSDPWTYDCWYKVVAVQSGVELCDYYYALEDATVAFDELCKNGFDTEAELAAQTKAAETWAQLESEVCTDDDYSIEE